MKKFVSILAVLLTMAVSSSAMSYEQARQQALFLTDKMAYELNLTDEQYEAAYEVNLDYLMSIDTYDNLYGTYWRQRNLDLSYILFSWQYRAFCDALYFYRPLYWNAGYWHFRVYSRYPHRDYYYFSRPRVFVSYCGGHSWRGNGGRSWYKGRSFGARPGREHFGMRDKFDRGDYGRGNRQNFGSRKDNGSSSFGNRESSTRTTVTRPSTSASFGGRRTSSTTAEKPSATFRPSASDKGNAVSQPSSSSFGGRRTTNRVTISRPGTTMQRPSTTARPAERFGGRRETTTMTRPTPSSSRFTPSTSRSSSSSGRASFGGGRSSSLGRSSSPSMSRSTSGGSRSTGSSRFGGRR